MNYKRKERYETEYNHKMLVVFVGFPTTNGSIKNTNIWKAFKLCRYVIAVLRLFKYKYLVFYILKAIQCPMLISGSILLLKHNVVEI